MSRFMPLRLTVLFVLMTAVMLIGPFVFGYVLGGGESPQWPPDRPIEWGTLIGVSLLFLALMALTITASLALKKSEAQARLQAKPGPQDSKTT